MGRAERRREDSCSAGWPRCTPASPSTPTRRSAASSTTSRSPASSTTRSIFYCADNGASGEGSPNGSVNERQVLQRLSRRHRGEPGHARPARQPGHLQPLPDRLGGGVLDAVPDVQALHVPGRCLRPAGHPLADGHQGQGRGARPVPPLHRHRADDPRRAAAWRCPTSSTASTQTPLSGVSMRYSFDDADAPTHEAAQYYEMLGTRGIWHEGWKAVAEHGADQRHGRLRQGPLAAVPHRRRPLRSARSGRPASRQARRAQGALVRGGGRQHRAAR